MKIFLYLGIISSGLSLYAGKDTHLGERLFLCLDAIHNEIGKNTDVYKAYLSIRDRYQAILPYHTRKILLFFPDFISLDRMKLLCTDLSRLKKEYSRVQEAELYKVNTAYYNAHYNKTGRVRAMAVAQDGRLQDYYIQKPTELFAQVWWLKRVMNRQAHSISTPADECD